ncbi:MAG: hypothetical protein LBB93_01825, partial [Elusimicrobiota bacterium]|nr:hypothetical protein [Elusimicrobiota bacterium]
MKTHNDIFLFINKIIVKKWVVSALLAIFFIVSAQKADSAYIVDSYARLREGLLDGDSHYNDLIRMELTGSSINNQGSDVLILGNDKQVYGDNFTLTLSERQDGIFFTRGHNLMFRGGNMFALTFLSNISANENGAVIGASHSLVGFLNSSSTFRDNASHKGGAMALDSSVASFEGGYVEFSQNDADLGDGGAIYASTASIGKFTGSKALFLGNTAHDGGAVELLESQMIFENSYIEANQNEVLGYGGWAYLKDNSNMSFVGSIAVVSNNSSNGRYGVGGAIALSKSAMTFSNGLLSFYYNSSIKNGGAVYIESSRLGITDSDVGIENNTSSDGSGGGIYASDSQINLESNTKDMQIYFANNSDVDGRSDIHMSRSTMTITAAHGRKVILSGGAFIGGNDSLIRKTGLGKLEINGSAQIKGKLSILNGEVFFNDKAPLVEEIEVSQNGALSLLNNQMGKLKVGTLTIAGTFSIDADFEAEDAASDTVDASSITIASGAVLKINSLSASKVGMGKTVTLMKAEHPIDGSFIYPKVYSLSSNGNSMFLTYMGTQCLDNIPNLTHNQIAVIDVIKEMDLDEEILADVIEDSDNPKRAHHDLDSVSGSFLANVMSAGARGDYGRMLDFAFDRQTGNKVWTIAGFEGFEVDNSDQSLGRFWGKGSRVRFGWDLATTRTFKAGVFGGYGNRNLMQDDNWAKQQDLEFGVYGGGSVFSKLDATFALAGVYVDNKTERKITLMKTYYSDAEFNSYGFRLGGQAELDIYRKYQHKKLSTAKPYIGIEGAYLITPSYYEDRGNPKNPTNLHVDDSEYMRLEITAGGKYEFKSNDMNCHIKGYGGILAVGDQAEYSMHFAAHEDYGKMAIASDEQAELFFGLDGGLEYDLKSKGHNTGLSLYVAGGFRFSMENYLSQYNGQFGLKFKLPASSKTNKTHEVPTIHDQITVHMKG